ncbi:MAG: hypothetical protein ACI4ED_08520 [Suilimivivens sp.]
MRWSYIYDMSLTPFLLIPILKESFGIRETKFAVTGSADKKKGWHWYYPIPFTVLYLLSVIALCKTGIMISRMRSGGYFFLLFWQLVNLYYMSFEILFIWRAKKEGEKIVVLQKQSAAERKKEFYKKWSGKRVRGAALTYLIEGLVILAVAMITHGTKSVLVEASYRNELERNDTRYFQMANWKNADSRFLNDFRTDNISFSDGQMHLALTPLRIFMSTALGGMRMVLPGLWTGRNVIMSARGKMIFRRRQATS